MKTEVVDGRLIVKEAHITPASGKFKDAQNLLGKEGLEDLARSLGREFGVKEIDISTKIDRIATEGKVPGELKKHAPFGEVRIVIDDSGKVTISRLRKSK